MNRLRGFVTATLAVLVIGFSVATPLTSYALTIQCQSTDASQCDLVKPKQTLTSQIWSLMQTALIALGGIAVLMIVIGGIMYVTSAGDSSKINAAKNTILYSVIGLAVAFFATAIVTLVNNFFG